MPRTCRWQGSTDDDRSSLQPASPRPFGAWFAEYIGGELPQVGSAGVWATACASRMALGLPAVRPPTAHLAVSHFTQQLFGNVRLTRQHPSNFSCVPICSCRLTQPTTGLVPRRHHGGAPQPGAAAAPLVLRHPAGAAGGGAGPRGRPLCRAQLGQHLPSAGGAAALPGLRAALASVERRGQLQ